MKKFSLPSLYVFGSLLIIINIWYFLIEFDYTSWQEGVFNFLIFLATISVIYIIYKRKHPHKKTNNFLKFKKEKIYIFLILLFLTGIGIYYLIGHLNGCPQGIYDNPACRESLPELMYGYIFIFPIFLIYSATIIIFPISFILVSLLYLYAASCFIYWYWGKYMKKNKKLFWLSLVIIDIFFIWGLSYLLSDITIHLNRMAYYKAAEITRIVSFLAAIIIVYFTNRNLIKKKV